MSLITQTTNVLVPPFSRDLGGNTYQYETKAVGGRTNAISGATKRRRHSQKRSRYSRQSKRTKSRVNRSRKFPQSRY